MSFTAFDDAPHDLMLLDKVTLLQEALISTATQDPYPEGFDYPSTRRELLQHTDIKDKLPDYVKRCRDFNHFWQFIKPKFGTYAERRRFIWDSFAPLLDYLEMQARTPSDASITDTLTRFDPESVHGAWQKALDRRVSDPEGAITAARTLLETVCKHILDDIGTPYNDNADLPKLWNLCAEELNLSPGQHSEKVFKAILGNCQSIVNNLAAIRNKISDAHGQGRRPVRPNARHAELAVNLAGTMASFLVATWQDRKAATSA